MVSFLKDYHAKDINPDAKANFQKPSFNTIETPQG